MTKGPAPKKDREKAVQPGNISVGIFVSNTRQNLAGRALDMVLQASGTGLRQEKW
jgi:hypothetical protein